MKRDGIAGEAGEETTLLLLLLEMLLLLLLGSSPIRTSPSRDGGGLRRREICFFGLSGFPLLKVVHEEVEADVQVDDAQDRAGEGGGGKKGEGKEDGVNEEGVPNSAVSSSFSSSCDEEPIRGLAPMNEEDAQVGPLLVVVDDGISNGDEGEIAPDLAVMTLRPIIPAAYAFFVETLFYVYTVSARGETERARGKAQNLERAACGD